LRRQRAGRGVDLAWPGFCAEIQAFDFGVWTDGTGEARDGSHEAERMSAPI
jgi:hypothetical protein